MYLIGRQQARRVFCHRLTHSSRWSLAQRRRVAPPSSATFPVARPQRTPTPQLHRGSTLRESRGIVLRQAARLPTATPSSALARSLPPRRLPACAGQTPCHETRTQATHTNKRTQTRRQAPVWKRQLTQRNLANAALERATDQAAAERVQSRCGDDSQTMTHI